MEKIVVNEEKELKKRLLTNLMYALRACLRKRKIPSEISLYEYKCFLNHLGFDYCIYTRFGYDFGEKDLIRFYIEFSLKNYKFTVFFKKNDDSWVKYKDKLASDECRIVERRLFLEAFKELQLTDSKDVVILYKDLEERN